jgi:hypothetical protein
VNPNFKSSLILNLHRSYELRPKSANGSWRSEFWGFLGSLLAQLSSFRQSHPESTQIFFSSRKISHRSNPHAPSDFAFSARDRQHPCLPAPRLRHLEQTISFPNSCSKRVERLKVRSRPRMRSIMRNSGLFSR